MNLILAAAAVGTVSLVGAVVLLTVVHRRRIAQTAGRHRPDTAGQGGSRLARALADAGIPDPTRGQAVGVAPMGEHTPTVIIPRQHQSRHHHQDGGEPTRPWTDAELDRLWDAIREPEEGTDA